MRELDKVIGYDGIKREMDRILDVLRNPEQYTILGVHVPKGILLYGEPGIGKSLLARCFMAESQRPFYIIRKNKSDGEFVDHIRKVFREAAENTPSMILLDDLDKFANADSNHRNAEEYVTVQACIDEVRDKEVFVIATVNNIRSLPGSLKRSGRFDKTFRMSFPKGKTAVKIISYYLSKKKVCETVDAEEIARFCSGWNCADMETVINAAGIHAGYEGKSLIGREDLIYACLRKHFNNPVDDTVVSVDELKNRVVHEAGHAVISEILKPGSVNFIAVSETAGSVDGITSTQNSEQFSFTDMETDIMVSLGGKAAVEIVLNEIDMGSFMDISSAFDTTRLLLDNHTAYDFHSWCHGKETSTHIYDRLDAATGAEIARYYRKTKKLLNDNRAFMDEIISELLKKKMLSYKDIKSIREKHRVKQCA